MKDSLCGGVVTDGCADIVELQEVGEAGEVANTGEMREGVGVCWVGDITEGGCDVTGEEDARGVPVAEMLIESERILEEVEVTVVVWEGVGGVGG